MRCIVAALFLFSSALFAQDKLATPIQLSAGFNYNGSTLTPELGPIAVPAHTRLGAPGSRFEMTIKVPEEGWITSFDHVQMNDPDTDAASLDLLVTVSNPERQDLLCRGREERIVNYGPGRPAWPNLDGYGYHVKAGDHLHMVVALGNSGVKPIGWKSMSIVFNFQPYNEGALRRDVLPMWFDVKGCGDSAFDLKPGTNISSGSFEVPMDGKLLAVQPALQKNATELDLDNHSHTEKFVHVVPKSDGGLPLQTPAEGAEWRLPKGDFLTISATYNNPDNKDAKAAATGIALGLFAPTDETAVSKMEKKSIPSPVPVR